MKLRVKAGEERLGLNVVEHGATIDGSGCYEIPWHRAGDGAFEQLRSNFAIGQPIKDLETQLNNRLGETRWLLQGVVPVCDEQGRLVTWLGTVHNVTAGKQAMLAEVEIAEAKSKAKGEFLANTSHEIRTPLNGVIGMLDLLATCKLPQKEKNFVDVARSRADTLLAQINDILDFSKIESGKLELENVDFDLREQMESTAEQFAIRAHIKGLEINCKLAGDLPFKRSCGF